MKLPPVDEKYFDREYETMARPQIDALQEELLLEMVPYAYEHSPLTRATWDAAGVHPRDIRSLDDFRERAPFVDKDTLRHFRDERRDPFGGLCTLATSELTAVMSTSGTTGDPTLVPEKWGGGGGGRPTIITRDFWGMGVRPGDYLALVLFTFRGPTYGLFQGLGTIPLLFDFDPAEMARFCELSLRYRPTGLYNFGTVLINAVRDACEQHGLDPVDVFSSYKGVVFAGEPLSPRARALAESWDVELYEHCGVGDVTAAFECEHHDGLHFWEDSAFVEGLDPDGDAPVADGERCELVATSLVNRTAPLVRYRSDDIVRITRETCRCGRTHARMWPIGRKGDEVVVDGRAILPIDIWHAVETVDACAMGLFQVIRTTRDTDELRLRVGFAPAWEDRQGTVRDEVQAAVRAATGIVPVVELVPNAALLRLGPPHKIPRVAAR
ncbi:MAG TPA: phenylacetate--CoA ligase family protein [Acidimicrobiia bacterium]|nr:phenylacetate--CoA ligase family protein [Acidimicrobiia bacterium]